MMTQPPFRWDQILRLGLVQTMLGAIVVLMTATINRVMVIELGLPAIVPGLLVASHYAIQVLRPAWGYKSDVGGRRTPWIIFGMASLALGGIGAASGTVVAGSWPVVGVAIAAIAFLLIGVGAGATGTSLLAMLATHVAPRRRAAAASLVWMMMILGFVISAPLAGHFLVPFSNERLLLVTGCVCAVAFLVATLAVLGVEGAAPISQPRGGALVPFRIALLGVLAEPSARRFTLFIFVSMLAYGAQDLLVEPFAGLAFGMSPGATTTLAGLQHGGVLAGMITVAALASGIGGRRLGSSRLWTVGGSLASSASLATLAVIGFRGFGPDAFRIGCFVLGFSNGMFAVAAIGAMMSLAGNGANAREGMRMGVWGAAQAIAFASGGVFATAAVDLSRKLWISGADAYAFVFALEAGVFVASAMLAAAAIRGPRAAQSATLTQDVALAAIQ